MFDFKYFTPTKVLFGKNTEDKVADLIQEFGGKKVLIHYGGGSVVRSGLMQRVTDKLDAAGIAPGRQIQILGKTLHVHKYRAHNNDCHNAASCLYAVP